MNFLHKKFLKSWKSYLFPNIPPGFSMPTDPKNIEVCRMIEKPFHFFPLVPLLTEKLAPFLDFYVVLAEFLSSEANFEADF